MKDNLINHISLYEGSCSSISSIIKSLFADDTTLPSGALFSELTVKCRTVGTNTYIGMGSESQAFRFTAANQARTYEAPVINGSVIPFAVNNIMVIGDVAGGAGVLEISGVRVYRDR